MERIKLDRTELMVEDKVLFKNEVYKIIHIYKSGYIEIGQDHFFKVDLVYFSEVKKI